MQDIMSIDWGREAMKQHLANLPIGSDSHASVIINRFIESLDFDINDGRLCDITKMFYEERYIFDTFFGGTKLHYFIYHVLGMDDFFDRLFGADARLKFINPL